VPVPQPSDQDRFDALWRAHHDAVLAYGLRRRPDLARDMVAETFLVAWRRLEEVPAEPRTWLLAVARRVLANQFRGEGRRRALLGRLGALRVEVAPDPGELAGEPGLRRAFASLAPSDRELIALSLWEELDAAGIAQVLGCSPGAATTRLYRARQRLQSALESDGAPDPITIAPTGRKAP
jgi:RNA polymerase sigma-70 factor (ECF subfamily)